MRKPIPIEFEKLKAAIDAVANKEMNYKTAAASLGINDKTLKIKAKAAGIELPVTRHKLPLSIRLSQMYTKQELEQRSQYDIARELNMTQPSVCAAYKELGIKSKRSGRASQDIKNARADAVIDYIQSNGGYVVPTIRKLGINVYKGDVYARARDLGIDLTDYRFAYREYGLWLTLPGHAERYQKSDYRLQAVCTGCGTQHKVQLVNLKTGASTGCRDCRNERKEFKRVKCIETGEVYKSIRSWTKAIDKLKSYQTLRIAIIKDNIYQHNGLNYRLIN